MAIDGAHWIVALNKIETEYPVDGLWEYNANGDTVIENLEYLKIYYRNLVITQDGPPYEAANSYHLAYLLRDDVEERKVFATAIEYSIGDCDMNEDILLYDFSLNVEDTVNFCLFPDWNIGTIGSIENTLLFGQNTIKYEIDSEYGDDDRYYEGIGSNYGLFEVMFVPYKKEVKYTEYTYLTDYCINDECELFLGSQFNITKNHEIQCYPNPSSEYVHFDQLDDYMGSHIYIYDILGNIISTLEINQTKVTWNTEHLDSGIYIYKIIGQDSKITGQVHLCD